MNSRSSETWRSPWWRSPTLIGFTAVLMWATLAPLTAWSGSIPPFQLTAIAFSIAFMASLSVGWRSDHSPLQTLRLPGRVWLLGVGGLFGYHYFYFLALQHAPVAQASLIAYLWPLLIVLLSAFLPGERWRWSHGIGAIAGFGGAALLVTAGETTWFEARYALGYLAALICALTWSSYSVLSRRYGAVPTASVGGFCGVTALLAWLCHWLWEVTVWPVGAAWFAVLGLGLGPVGLAFFTWDYGVKHGDIRLLGTLAYAAPLLSTLLLVLVGLAAPSWRLAIACLTIIGGAAIAVRGS
ncbi:MAG: DMT family transporter [Spirulinaceae cyanobacterium SM2_1_0]|nr:DMT family transporter [Spirulinaceae cyanobacterium SM2_1_0]